MKAISLSAPYGTLIALCERFPTLGKHIETRGRATRYRGALAIHQAKSLRYVGGMAGLRDLCVREPFTTSLRAAGVDLDVVDVDALPLGAIVATCELLDCVETWPRWATITPWLTASWNDITYHVPPGVGSYERAFGDYAPGRWAWLLGNIRMLPAPIPCRGRQWLWDVGSTIETQIATQFAAPRCPHCGTPYDVAHRVSGDRVWCTICDGWFLIHFVDSGAQLLACDPPAG